MKRLIGLCLLVFLTSGCTLSRFYFVINHTEQPVSFSITVSQSEMRYEHELKVLDSIPPKIKIRDIPLFQQVLEPVTKKDSTYFYELPANSSTFIHLLYTHVDDLRFEGHSIDSLPIQIRTYGLATTVLFDWRGMSAEPQKGN